MVSVGLQSVVLVITRLNDALLQVDYSIG